MTPKPSPDIHCRPVTTQLSDQDEAFLRRLIIATMAEELAAWAWPEAMRDQLLDMQYRIRRQGIAANYPTAERFLVIQGGEPVGWVVVSRSEVELHIIDLAILPDRRGCGIGTAVLSSLLVESDRCRVPARLHVNVTNRAVHLYERLGFVRTGGDEVQHIMERPPRP